MRIEEDLKDERLWLRHPSEVNNIVSEVRVRNKRRRVSEPQDKPKSLFLLLQAESTARTALTSTDTCEPALKGGSATHETISGCSANGSASLGNIRSERTRTGDENLSAARFEGPAGSSVDQWSNMVERRTATAPTQEAAVPSCHAIPLHQSTMSGRLSPPSIKLPGLSLHPNHENPTQRRGRSGSFLKVEHVDSSNEEALDQAAYTNINAEWVNRKGRPS